MLKVLNHIFNERHNLGNVSNHVTVHMRRGPDLNKDKSKMWLGRRQKLHPLEGGPVDSWQCRFQTAESYIRRNEMKIAAAHNSALCCLPPGLPDTPYNSFRPCFMETTPLKCQPFGMGTAGLRTFLSSIIIHVSI